MRAAFDSRSILDGGKVRALREARGWTQKYFGEVAGLDALTVRHVEQSRNGHHRSTLDAVAYALGVPLEDLAPKQQDGPAALLPPLGPRLDALLDEYDAAPRGTTDHLLAALVRAVVSAHGAISRGRKRDEARAARAEAVAS